MSRMQKRPSSRYLGLALCALGVVALPAQSVGKAGISPSHGCPAAAPAQPAAGDSSATGPLVPRHARRVVLCRYNGLDNTPASALAQARVLKGRARSRALQRRFNRLPATPDGARACPSDDGTVILARFYTGHAAPTTVTTHVLGCRDATSGTVTRTAIGSDRLINRLEALTGCVPTGRIPACED